MSDPKKGTGKKPKGSGRRLYTDEDPGNTVSVEFSSAAAIKRTLAKSEFKSKSHKRQSQIINLIHQRVRAAYENAKKPDVKARLKKAFDYATERKEASKRKTKRMQKSKNEIKDIIMQELMSTMDEESLHKWFKGGGWRQAGGKYDGKPCARQPGQKTTPKCVSRSKYKSMSKKERESAGRRKRKKDPGQTKKTGAAKPTYVKTDPQKGGKKKKKNEAITIDKQRLMEIIKEEFGAAFVEEYQMIEASYDDGSPLSEDFEFYESLDEQQVEEAVYQGKTVKLNKPTRGDVKKFKVYVNSGKKDKKGRIKAKKVNFGDKKMRIKKSNPKRRKSFRARHNCANPGPKTKARYWSCKKW